MKQLLTFAALIVIAAGAEARNLYIPVAGEVPGANGTYFRTDVRIFNPSSVDDIDVSIHFLPTGIEGSNIPGQVFHVPKRQMLVLNNVLRQLAGVTTPAVGALRLDSDTDKSYDFIAESRTYTDSPNPAVGGTYGQYIPALDVTSAFEKTVITHASHNANYRTNVGIMNPQRVPAVITPSLVLPDGTLIAEGAQLTIPAMSMIQMSVPAMFGTDRQFDDAFVVIDSTQAVFGFMSIIDNRTGDPFFVPGAEDKAGVQPLEGTDFEELMAKGHAM